MWQGVDEMKRRFAFALSEAPESLNFAIVGLASLLRFLKFREDFVREVPVSTPVLRQYATELHDMAIELVGAAVMDDDQFLISRESPFIHTVQGVVEETLDVKAELKEILLTTDHWFLYLTDQEAKAAERICRAAASAMMAFFEGFDEEYLLPEQIARSLFQVIEKMEARNMEVISMKARKGRAKKRRCFRRTFIKSRRRKSTGRTGTSHALVFLFLHPCSLQLDN